MCKWFVYCPAGGIQGAPIVIVGTVEAASETSGNDRWPGAEEKAKGKFGPLAFAVKAGPIDRPRVGNVGWDA